MHCIIDYSYAHVPAFQTNESKHIRFMTRNWILLAGQCQLAPSKKMSKPIQIMFNDSPTLTIMIIECNHLGKANRRLPLKQVVEKLYQGTATILVTLLILYTLPVEKAKPIDLKVFFENQTNK